jgi:hypothetical protein
VSDVDAVVSYAPPGEQAARFHNEFAFVRGLLGPVGSGKSSSCCAEILFHTMRQNVWNGKRRARWAVIRNTYPELKTTTIKTWQAWFPDTIAPIKWDTPITSRMVIKDIGDGSGLDLEVIFMALDRPEEVGKLKSLELTGVWLNEVSELPKEILDMATQRVGRFPERAKGDCVDPCVIMDTNPPDDDHWYYTLAEEDTPAGWKFFRQPGGLVCIRDADGKPTLDANGRMTWVPNPDAENVNNLPGGYAYYERMMGGKTDGWISVFCGAQYGRINTGRPVYPEYNDLMHSAQVDVEATVGIPVYVGWDFGLTPAAVFVQPTLLGQLLVLDELCEENMDVREFADSVVKPFIVAKYARHKLIHVGDPAGLVRSQIDRKRTPFTELLEAGIPCEPAESNDFLPRKSAVSYYLNRMSGGKPAFRLNRRCVTLRKGFNGGYHYERVKASGEALFRDQPKKNAYSHPHDALQYACLKIRGGSGRPRVQQVLKTGRART